jgi:hypothetical protein
MSGALWNRHAPLRLKVGRNVFKSNHHDRDVVVRVSLRGLANQLFRRKLRIRDGPYKLTGCLVIQNVPYLRFIRRADQKRRLLLKCLVTHPIAG